MHSNFPIIEKLGGRAAVRDELARRGIERSLRAIAAWNQRRSIPGEVQTALMLAAEDRHIAVAASDFLHPQNGRSQLEGSEAA